jgi:cytochrome c peroxidase
MKKHVFLFAFFFSFSCQNNENELFLPQENLVISKANNTFKKEYSSKELREIYSKSSSNWPKPDLDPTVQYKEIGLLPNPIFPSNNPYSFEKSSLGQELFFDKNLSGSKKLSCSSCHNPNQGWSDGNSLPSGHNGIILKRNSPTILNSAHNNVFFWDGRASSLEDQTIKVLTNPDEMHTTPEEVEKYLNSSENYRIKFKKAFGTEKISFDMAVKAITTFERTVNTKNQSNFDKFLKGDKNILSDSQINGLHLFRTKARCMNCHNGPNFTDNKFHNLSLTYIGTEKEDLGRYYITKNPADWGVFKTPTLRNVSKTSPYMHNGVFTKLNKILNLYNDGMHGKDENKSPLIVPLGLSEEEIKNLEDFLLSLSE